ncbi:DUF927 domain-containing protein [Variovorax sp. 38R]|uniref:DUF927 domain-containing protein n=1 Tax=Variovorax sp. 38R TaxID=2774875 RepID=UPI00177E0F09|nr:DUF927 domain-containing protein [Variovorax sp. 38R]QOF77566.1 DUF927 domain-containing protein [Variovorax sp. 38R]
MSKKKVHESARPLAGPGQFRQQVESVRFAVTTRGVVLQKIGVLIAGNWHLMDTEKLAKGQSDEIVTLCLRNAIPVDIGIKDRRELCEQLLAAPEGQVMVFDPSAYQRVHFEDRDAEAFVWRDELHWVGDEPELDWFIQESRVSVPADAQGTLKEWKGFAKCFRGNHYLVVGLGAALSALLTGPLGAGPLSLVFVGRSAIGKSAMQSALQSIIRPPGLDSASGSLRGLQQALSELGGQPVFLEDLRQLSDPHGWVELLFDIGNRSSRVVGQPSQVAVTGRAMECLVIASNERTIAEMLAGKKYDGGLDSRVLQLEMSGAYGAFHELPDDMDGAQFADHLKSGASRVYGCVWDEWVQVIAKNLSEIREQWSSEKEALVDLLLEARDPVDGAVRRVIEGCAFWMFCLKVAAENELVPLSTTRIETSFREVIQEHLAARRSGIAPQAQRILDDLRSLIRDQPSKFPELSVDAMATDKRLGFRKTYKGQEYYLFQPDVLVKLIGDRAVGRRDVFHALRSAKLLKTSESRDTLMIHMPDGTKVRMLAVSATVLSDE